MAAEPLLSANAQARMAALLPALLGEVRARGRRRRRTRRAIVAACCTFAAWLAWPLVRSADVRVAPAPPPHASGWTIVRDDDSVLARCRVATHVRDSWWLADDALRAELRRCERPDGLVRTGGAVRVHASALDPWPAEDAP